MGRCLINKYSILLFFLIALQVFGNIGGAYQPIRIFIVCLLPFLFERSRCLLFCNFEFCFFLFWISNALVALFWVIDFHEAITEIFYLVVNFSSFFILVLLSTKIGKAEDIIITSWIILFVLTIPVALYELMFDVHLWTTVFEDGKMIGGNSGIVKKYAAVTFGNYNGYVQLLIYVSPFIASQCLYGITKIKKIIGWILFFVLFYILLMIASRSGLLAIVLVLAFLLYNYRTISIKKRLLVYVLVGVVIVVLLLFFSESLLEQVAYRLVGSEFFQDSTRENLIFAGFQMLSDTFFLGVGPGNYVAASRSFIPMNSFPPHNLFMEILSQYGICVFVFFVILMFRIFLRKREANNQSGFIVRLAMFLFPIAAVVDSGYLRNILLWIWIASLFVLSRKMK